MLAIGLTQLPGCCRPLVISERFQGPYQTLDANGASGCALAESEEMNAIRGTGRPMFVSHLGRLFHRIHPATAAGTDGSSEDSPFPRFHPVPTHPVFSTRLAAASTVGVKPDILPAPDEAPLPLPPTVDEPLESDAEPEPVPDTTARKLDGPSLTPKVMKK